MLTSREVVLVKKETTYNTDAAPVAANDALLIGNPSWSHEGLRMNERNTVKNTNGVNQHIFGGTLKTISLEIELKGSGAAGTAPEFGVLFEACSYDETIIPSTSVIYAPTSTTADQKSVTVYYYQDGLCPSCPAPEPDFISCCDYKYYGISLCLGNIQTLWLGHEFVNNGRFGYFIKSVCLGEN